MPAAVRRLLRRCLAKDVGQRLQHIGDARLELEEAQNDAPVSSDRKPARSRWPTSVRWALTGAALVVAIAAVVRSWQVERGSTGPTDRVVARLTLSLQGDANENPGLVVTSFFIPFALSPAGDWLVYRTRSTKASQLFLRELSGFELKPLPGTQTATTPFFSPDGRWVGFWRAEDRILRRVSVAGGSPMEIGPTDVPIRALWGTNDEIVFEAGSKGQLWSIPAGGGKPQEIVVQDRSDRELISLRGWGPAGNDLLVASTDPEGTWLEVLSRDTGKRRRVLKGGGTSLARYPRSDHLVYSDADALFAVPLDHRLQPVGTPTPVIHGIDSYSGHSNAALSDNGTLVYLPAERVREAELGWLDRRGIFMPVPGGRAPFASMALSPGGREVAGNLVEGAKEQVWIIDLARGARRLLISQGDSIRPIWSRDGKFITYLGHREGAQGLYRTRSDGTGVEELVVRLEGGYAWPEDWSPDGQSLLFSGYTDRGDSDVWIYARGKATRLMASAFNEAGATFSPDGRFIAFEADDGGVSHVYVQPFPGPGARTGRGEWLAPVGSRWATPVLFEQQADHGRDGANQTGPADWPAGASGRPGTGL